MSYKLFLGNEIFRKGSLLFCLLSAYGIDDFTIRNDKGFCFVFHHVGLGKAHEPENKIGYDADFFYRLNYILTTKELDKFKKKIRTFEE